MFIRNSATLTLMMLSVACASNGADAVALKTPIQGGVVEFALHSFDGKTMKGRLLLGATIDKFELDARMIEDVHIELRQVRRCGTSEPLKYWAADWYLEPPRPDQQIAVRPGYWYGADLDFKLFDASLRQPEPHCFEADMWVWSLDRRIIAKHPIRVERTDISRGTSQP